jgi:Zn-finger protein
MTMSVGVYGERLWQCTDCNYSHKKTTNVIDHIEAKHFDERVFCTL